MSPLIAHECFLDGFDRLVDRRVLRVEALADELHQHVDPVTKRCLTRVGTYDVQFNGMTSTISLAAIRLAQSLARSFERKKADLPLFDPPTPIEWRTIVGAVLNWFEERVG